LVPFGRTLEMNLFRSIPLILLLCAVLGSKSTAQDQPTVDLTLLLTGNTYGYFDVTPVGKELAGGIVRRKTVVERIRREVGNDHLLLLDAGNALGYFYLLRGDRGSAMISAMHTVGYDAMTVGNHELDYGRDMLREYHDLESGVNIVCANLVLKSTNEPFLRPYVIEHKANGIRVGILGLTDPMVEQTTLRQHIEGLAITDPIVTAKKHLSQLQKEADVIIALSFLSLDDCYRLAMAVPEIDVIVACGESVGTPLILRRETGSDEHATFVVSPIRLGSGIVRVHLRYAGRTRSTSAALLDVLPVDTTISGDVGFAAWLAVGGEQQYYEYCRKNYDVEPDEPLMLIDSSFTNNHLTELVLQILLQQSGAELSLLNNTFFRFEGIEIPRYEGDPRSRKLTVRLLEQILWTDNELVTMKLTGQQLSVLQRLSAANSKPGRGNHLQHLQVTTDGFEDWYVHNAPLQQKSPPELYHVATSNFLAGGGNGYTPFREGRQESFRFLGDGALRPSDDGTPVIIRELVIHHLKRLRDASPHIPAKPGAIIDSLYRARNLWRFTLARLQLSYSAGEYRSSSAYKNIGLTELRGTDFERITYEADLRLKQESKWLLWDNRLYAAFGQSKITDQPLQEVLDDLFFETVVNLRFSRGTGSISIYPSASARYDTELTPTESKQTNSGVSNATKNPRQQDVTIGVGAGFSEFAGFSRTRISLTQTFDRSSKPRPDENGINLQTTYQVPVVGSLFRSELDGTYYIKQKRSSGDTRSLLVRWKSDLAIPLGRLRLAPSLYVFLFHGRQSLEPAKSPPLATTVVFGISLGYSLDWKMQYESLF